MANSNQKIIIITAPSGAGKTSITHYLISQFASLQFSISAATRSPRGTEKNGVDYLFMSIEDFQKKIKEHAFVEWEMVYDDKYYGTLKAELQRIWDLNKVPLLDIDVKGAIHVQQQFGSNALSIFIEPPTVEELKIRLEARGTETAESLQTRINKAAYEMSFNHHFNAIIINDDLDIAKQEAKKIVGNFLG